MALHIGQHPVLLLSRFLTRLLADSICFAPGVGFNDPTPAAPIGGNTGTTRGQQRLIAFQFAADVWGALLPSPVEIKVTASFDPLTCSPTSAVLGSAGTRLAFTDFAGAPQAATWYPAALANKLAGYDLAAAVSYLTP